MADVSCSNKCCALISLTPRQKEVRVDFAIETYRNSIWTISESAGSPRAELRTASASSSRPLLTSHLQGLSAQCPTKEKGYLPRREWHEQNTNPEDDGGNKLESQRDTPCSGALSFTRAANVVGAIVDPEGDHDTESDC